MFHVDFALMSSEEQALDALQAAVAKQGDVVRSLKAEVKDGKAEKVGSIMYSTILDL